MCLIIVASSARLSKSPVEQPEGINRSTSRIRGWKGRLLSSIRAPCIILRLLLHNGPQIHASVELIRLRSWVADPSLIIQTLGDLASQQLHFGTVGFLTFITR